MAERHRVDVTPTVVAFVEGGEASRIDGKPFLGIPRTSYGRWVRALPA